MSRFACVLLAAAAGLLASPASATEQDAQFWLYFNTVVPVAEGTNATFEFSPRVRGGPEHLLLRANVDSRVAEGLTLGGAVARVEYSGGHEFRLHQQAMVAAGPVQLRSRFEQRFFAGAARPQLRLRQQASLRLPLADNTQFQIATEAFYIVQDEQPGASDRVEQLRLDLLVRQRLSPQLDLVAGYRGNYFPRAGREDLLVHVPMVVLTFRP